VLKVDNLRKSFLSDKSVVHAVDGVSFEVGAGEFFTLLGPSGCGKSTTLRCIAGLENITSGRLLIDGELVASDKIFIEANHRPIAMVFQSYAIWPHMTVLENVTFPLSYRSAEASSRASRITRRELGMEALKMVQLDHLADRDAPYLSGGQQQRVALARALVVHPKLLLLDEPLSNLDAKLREDMRYEIKELTSRLGISTMYVTHDQAEALSMSDRIAVMSRGKILQLGTPREIYLEPQSSSVARIVGNINVFRGKKAGGSTSPMQNEIRLASGTIFRCPVVEGRSLNEDVEIMFRPELVRVRSRSAGLVSDEPDKVNTFNAQVKRVDFTGDHLKVHFETPDGEVIAKLPPDQVLPPNGEVSLVVRVENCTAH